MRFQRCRRSRVSVFYNVFLENAAHFPALPASLTDLQWEDVFLHESEVAWSKLLALGSLKRLNVPGLHISGSRLSDLMTAVPALQSLRCQSIGRLTPETRLPIGWSCLRALSASIPPVTFHALAQTIRVGGGAALEKLSLGARYDVVDGKTRGVASAGDVCELMTHLRSPSLGFTSSLDLLSLSFHNADLLTFLCATTTEECLTDLGSLETHESVRPDIESETRTKIETHIAPVLACSTMPSPSPSPSPSPRPNIRTFALHKLVLTSDVLTDLRPLSFLFASLEHLDLCLSWELPGWRLPTLCSLRSLDLRRSRRPVPTGTAINTCFPSLTYLSLPDGAFTDPCVTALLSIAHLEILHANEVTGLTQQHLLALLEVWKLRGHPVYGSVTHVNPMRVVRLPPTADPDHWSFDTQTIAAARASGAILHH